MYSQTGWVGGWVVPHPVYPPARTLAGHRACTTPSTNGVAGHALTAVLDSTKEILGVGYALDTGARCEAVSALPPPNASQLYGPSPGAYSAQTSVILSISQYFSVIR